MNTHHKVTRLFWIVMFIAMLTTGIEPGAAKNETNNLYYKMRFTLTSWAGWTTVIILPPWDSNYYVTDTTLIEPTDDTDSFRISVFGINEYLGSTVNKIEVDYIVYLKSSCRDDFSFAIGKGAEGDSELTICGFDTDKGKFKRLRTFSNSTSSDTVYYKLPFTTIKKLGCVNFNPPEK